MPEQEKTDGHPDTATDQKDASDPTKGLLRWTLIIGAIALLILIVVSVYHPHLTERVKFLVGSSLSLFVLLAVIVQAVIYRGQWKAMNEQRTVMGDQLKTMQQQFKLACFESNQQRTAHRLEMEIMKLQSEAMKGQLDAMKEQTTVMEKSLVIGTRAYVGVHSITLRREEPQSLAVKIENIGHVPAEEIELSIELIAIMPDGWTKQHPTLREFHRHTIRESFGRTKLFRGNLQIMFVTSLATYLAKEEIPIAISRTGILGVGGVIEYFDGFNSGRQRTEFNFLYFPEEDAWYTESPDILATKTEKKDKKANPN
jgi:uncharacterized integral membrane protein